MPHVRSVYVLCLREFFCEISHRLKKVEQKDYFKSIIDLKTLFFPLILNLEKSQSIEKLHA